MGVILSSHALPVFFKSVWDGVVESTNLYKIMHLVRGENTGLTLVKYLMSGLEPIRGEINTPWLHHCIPRKFKILWVDPPWGVVSVIDRLPQLLPDRVCRRYELRLGFLLSPFHHHLKLL